jgi:hypothetical protein
VPQIGVILREWLREGEAYRTLKNLKAFLIKSHAAVVISKVKQKYNCLIRNSLIGGQKGECECMSCGEG